VKEVLRTESKQGQVVEESQSQPNSGLIFVFCIFHHKSGAHCYPTFYFLTIFLKALLTAVARWKNAGIGPTSAILASPPGQTEAGSKARINQWTRDTTAPRLAFGTSQPGHLCQNSPISRKCGDEVGGAWGAW